MKALVAVLALVACGPKRGPPMHEYADDETASKRGAQTATTGAQTATTTPDGGEQPSQKGVRQTWNGPPPACPASFAAATGTCPVEQECDYHEGTCRCEEPSYCGGANIRRPPEPLEWSCVKPTPAIRPDGCPGNEARGAACGHDGKECKYGGCCVTTLTCDGGHWIEKKPVECPP